MCWRRSMRADFGIAIKASSEGIRNASVTSSTWSPIATPTWDPVPRRKVANGRFWIGKSVSGWLADSTQLCSAGS